MKILELITYDDINKAFHDLEDVFEDLNATVFIDEYIKKITNFAKVFVIIDNDKCIAFAAVYMNDYQAKHAYITLIGVSSDYQNEGIGSRLLAFCEEQAREEKMQDIQLEVKKENCKAQCFYKKNGYYYLGKETDISYYMEKKLSEETF